MNFPSAIVKQSLTTSGLINSKPIENIVTLHSTPIEFDSSLAFESLEAISVLSDNRISGINFTKWFEETLWKNGKEGQSIKGNWKLKKAFLNENVYGNGLINKKSINEIEKNLKINVNAIEMTISNYSGQYSDMCVKLQYRAEDFAKNSVYILKYFESAFTLSENEEIFSHFAFKTKDHRDFVLINTNCTTHVYKWHRSEEKFIKMNSIETGVIYDWLKIENNGVLVITNSRMAENAPCKYGGLHTWELSEDTLVHFDTISQETDILELHVIDSMNSNSFYALENSDNVINYNASGGILEKWKLPTENFTYSFLPSNLLYGINLSNGRRIFSLDSKSFRRDKRFLFGNTPVMKMTTNATNSEDSPTFTFKMPDISFSERKNSIPTIPSKPIKTTKRIDFMSKVKEAGDVIRRSFNLQTVIAPEVVKKSNDTTTTTTTDEKLARLNDTNKLLFIINSPNISSLKPSNANLVDKSPIKDSIINTLIQNKTSSDDQSITVKPTEKVIETSTESAIQPTSTSQSSLGSNLFSFTPRIIMPTEDHDENLKEEHPSNEINLAAENEERVYENKVDTLEIQGTGVRDMENVFIPEHGFGEVTVLYVGTESNRKALYAITRKRNSLIKREDFIEVNFALNFNYCLN